MIHVPPQQQQLIQQPAPQQMTEEEQLAEAIRLSEIENAKEKQYQQQLETALRISEVQAPKREQVTLSMVANVIEDYFKAPEPPGRELESKLMEQMKNNAKLF